MFYKVLPLLVERPVQTAISSCEISTWQKCLCKKQGNTFMWEVNLQLSDAATAVGRGSVLEGVMMSSFYALHPPGLRCWNQTLVWRTRALCQALPPLGTGTLMLSFPAQKMRMMTLSRVLAPKAGMYSCPAHPIESTAGDEPCQSPKGAVRTFKPTQRGGTLWWCGQNQQHVTPLAWEAREQRAEGRMRSPAGWKKRELLPPWEYSPEAFSFPFGKDKRNTVHLLYWRVPIPPQPSSPSPASLPKAEPPTGGLNK